MKKLVVALAAIVLAGAAQAETKVQLYGLVDAGVTYIDNVKGDSGAIVEKGHSNVLVDTGVLNGNRWGLKGREEINENIAGVFQVESGFALDTGKSNQGGRLFGRQAYLGAEVKNVGTVSFGRQYDFMGDLGDYSTMANQYGGAYTENNFHSVDRVGGDRVDNSIKFQSASLAGVSFGAMVGTGDENSAKKKAGRALSAKLGYDGFPGLSVGAAYTRVNGSGTESAAKLESYGVGASYAIGNAGTVNGVASFNKGTINSVLDSTISVLNTNTGLSNSVKKFNVYELGYTHKFTPELSAGLGLQFLDNRTVGAKKHDLMGGNVAVNYELSKRTNAYGLVVYQQSKKVTVGGATSYLPVDVTGNGMSDSNKQVAVRVGLRHKF